MLNIGDPAPDFVGRTTQGRQVSLKDYSGKYLVLFFYPKAFTAGCTIETKLFRDRYPEIRALGGEVLGLSSDDFDTQCEFAEQYGVGFELVADKEKKILAAYHINSSPLPFVSSRRVTYIVGPDGKIADIIEHNLVVTKHVSDVVDFLKAHPNRTAELLQAQGT